MTDSPRLMERAFELARSGRVPSIDQLRAQLKRERFESVDQHITGSLVRQLRDCISTARSETCK